MSKVRNSPKMAFFHKPLSKFSLNDAVNLAQFHISKDSYAERNAKEIDRQKDKPATLPKGWRNLPNL